jgi:hypothetical protein
MTVIQQSGLMKTVKKVKLKNPATKVDRVINDCLPAI